MKYTDKKCRILLISINTNWRYSNVGIDQVAGYLRSINFEVDILYHHQNINFDDVIKSLDLSYNIYGLSVNSLNIDCCLAIANYIKKQSEHATVVFGGGYPTRYYREIFELSKDIDYIILGDGEIPFENLLKHLISGNDLNFDTYIARPDQHEGKQPYCNRFIDYYPALDYFENDTKARNLRKEYCLQTKNNVCTGKCSFCTERKGIITYKNIDHIINEIDIVYRRFGIKKFFFTDDNILDPNNVAAKLRIYDLCDAIQNLSHNLVFKCYIKANSLHDTEEDNKLLQKMSDTGFKTIFVGIESGNIKDLKLYNKFTTVDENYSVIQLLRKHEIAPQIGFINFNPYSTLDTIKENYRFLVDIKMNNLFMYVYSYMRVYKYTEMYNKILKDGLTIPGETYLDEKSIYKFLNSDVQHLFDFIKKHMLYRIRNLDFEFDWIYSFFLECKKINSRADIYFSEFEEINAIQLQYIKEFFHILFIENNIEKSTKHVDEFLSFFEHMQPRFANIYRQLLKIWTTSD